MHDSVGCRVFNTHLLWHMLPKGSNMRYIYIVRSGKDVLVSFFKHLSHQLEGGFEGGFDEFVEKWCSGEIAYGTWSNHLR